MFATSLFASIRSTNCVRSTLFKSALRISTPRSAFSTSLRALNENINNSNTHKGPIKTVFVGNLPFVAKPDELAALFEKFGYVSSSRIIFNSVTGRSRGFGYVEMDESAAATAIEKLNGFQFLGRELRVNEALPPSNDRRPPRRFQSDNRTSPRIEKNQSPKSE